MTERSEVFSGKRAAILERWFQAVLATYPPDAARFMAGGKDRFQNPVGHTIRDGLAALLDGLAAGRAGEGAAGLDDIVRIRAVQELAPSTAVAFVYDLRGILREELAGGGLGADDLAAFDVAIDRLALAAFDVYMQCRQRLFDIRARELREQVLLGSRAAG
jgi:hypothetical protein